MRPLDEDPARDTELDRLYHTPRANKVPPSGGWRHPGNAHFLAHEVRHCARCGLRFLTTKGERFCSLCER